MLEKLQVNIAPIECVDLIYKHIRKTGESMNAFICRAISETMSRDNKKQQDRDSGYLFRRVSGGNACVYSFGELPSEDKVDLIMEINAIKRVQETGKPGRGIYDPFMDAIFSVMKPGADDFVLLASLDNDQLDELSAACESSKIGTSLDGASVTGFSTQYEPVCVVAGVPTAMRFDTPEQMLEFINAGNDLYSEMAAVYVFRYNEAGSICTYNLGPKIAADLAGKAKAANEYWSAFLGFGGQIWDDPSHECYCEGRVTNLDCCVSLIQYDDWVLTSNYADELTV